MLGRERSPKPVPGTLHASSDGVGGSTGGVAASAMLTETASVLVGKVASAATTNMINWGLMLHHLALSLKLFVEAENGTFLREVHVAGTAAAGGVIRACVGTGGESGAGCGTSGIRTGSELGWVDLGDVARTATAGADVVAGGRDRGVRFGDAVAGGNHFEGLALVGVAVVVWGSGGRRRG